MNSQTDIGQKIQYFRKIRGLSQLDLEIAIEAAPGSISRIESGKTNPTKETVLNIATALNLQPAEVGYILGINSSTPTISEINNARDNVKGLLSSGESLSYLLDNRSIMLDVSIGLRSFLETNGVQAERLIGKNILQIIFDPSLELRQLIDKDGFQMVSQIAIAVLHQERPHVLKEKWWGDLFEELHKLPDFTNFYNQTINKEMDLLSEESRTILFNLGDQIIKMFYTPIYLYQDPRFVIKVLSPLQ